VIETDRIVIRRAGEDADNGDADGEGESDADSGEE
jgi:hypothetical protein